MHSFTDTKGGKWTACCECNRGGNGSDKNKCSSGWRYTKWNGLGCFMGSEIIGKIKLQPKISKSKERYQRFLEYGDGFASFRNFLSWDGEPERSWNK